MFTRVPNIIYLIVYLNLLGVTMLKFNETNYWNEKKYFKKNMVFNHIKIFKGVGSVNVPYLSTTQCIGI